MGGTVFDACNIALMGVLLLAFLLPFLFVINGSIVRESEFLRTGGVILFPRSFSLATYKFLINDGAILASLAVSVARLVVGVPAAMLMTLLLAYALTQREMPGYRLLMLFIVFMMYFDGGMVPFYMLIRDIGLYDTFWVYILPALVSVYNALLLRNFLNTIPSSLPESARLDGAGEMCVLTRIILPLAKPGIATIALFVAVALWNDWFTGMVYIRQGASAPPLQTYLRKILDLSSLDLNEIARVQNDVAPMPEPMKMAAIVITTIPIVIVYPFVQKYFISGIMVGAVKE